MPSSAYHRVYRFGRFRFFIDDNVLLRDGRTKPVQLSRMNLSLLKLLVIPAIRNPNRFISREEIKRGLWKDSEDIAYSGGKADRYKEADENRLDRQVTNLRLKLREADGSGTDYLVVAKGQGIRLAVKVEPEKLNLAVLPFRIIGADRTFTKKQLNSLEVVIRDALITRLATNPELHVSEVSEHLLGQSSNVKMICRRLRVQKILRGTIHAHGHEARVTGRLINSDGIDEITPPPIKIDLDNVSEAADLIAAHFENALKIPLTDELKRLLKKRGTENKQADQLYRQGRVAWIQHVGPGIKLAMENFDKAIKLDSRFVLPYTGLADAYFNLASFGNEVSPPKQVMELARRNALRAIRLDPTCVEAHVSLGNIHCVYDWDFKKAERRFKKALHIEPDHANAHHYFALSLAMANKFTRAIEEIDRAKELGAGELKINASRGWILYFAGQYERGIEQCREVIGMAPWYILGHVFLGYNLIQVGDLSGAIQELQWIVNNIGGIPAVIGVLGYAYALNGDKREARKLIKTLHRLSQEHYFSPYNEAMIRLGLGETDEVFRLLEKAFVERSSWMILLGVEPMLEKLSDDERFRSLITRVHYTKGVITSLYTPEDQIA